MSNETIVAQVSAILDGWTPTPSMGALARQSGGAWLVGGIIDGTPFIKHTGLAPNGPDTPDDPIEAAHWLVAHVAGLRGPVQIEALEIEETAEPDHDLTDGIAGPDSMVYEGSPVEADELAYDDPSGDVGEAPTFDAPDDPDLGDVADEPDPAQLGGVLIQGDALATAKAIALMAVDDERFARVGDYDKAENQTRLDELRQIQQAIREGVHPAFTDEQTEELQALETFLPFMQRIDDYAQSLRDAIRAAGDLEVLTSIDILNGWPE